jgi:nicotinamide riboside transporter PnuC
MIFVKAVLAGVALALSSAAIIWLGNMSYPYEIHAMLLSSIGAIYIGFGLLDSSPKNTALEVIIAALFFCIAITGYLVSPVITGVGFLMHGIWDFLHHPKLVTTVVPKWYPPFCAIYDWVLAACFFCSFFLK